MILAIILSVLSRLGYVIKLLWWQLQRTVITVSGGVRNVLQSIAAKRILYSPYMDYLQEGAFVPGARSNLINHFAVATIATWPHSTAFTRYADSTLPKYNTVLP